MKNVLSIFLALIMVFTLFPVSTLAEEDASGETPAEEMTQIAEEPQPDPGETPEEPAENNGETPEEVQEEPAKETPEAETPEAYAADARIELYAAAEEETSVEDKLRADIAGGMSELEINGDCVLSADLTIEENVNVDVKRGTFTVPAGVTLTINAGGYFGVATEMVIGGTVVINGRLWATETGSITVETGGTVENNDLVGVVNGGSFRNNGTYTFGTDGALYFYNMTKETDLDASVTGVDWGNVTIQSMTDKEAALRAVFAAAEKVSMVSCIIFRVGSVELTDDLTVPSNGNLYVNGTLTVPEGKNLTNHGFMNVNGSLTIAAGATITNRNIFMAFAGSRVSMAGTFENTGWANAYTDGWNCTGEIVNNGTFLLNALVATADELEAALQPAAGMTAKIVKLSADITIDRSMTVPEGVQLSVFDDRKLTVSAPPSSRRMHRTRGWNGRSSPGKTSRPLPKTDFSLPDRPPARSSSAPRRSAAPAFTAN